MIYQSVSACSDSYEYDTCVSQTDTSVDTAETADVSVNIAQAEIFASQVSLTNDSDTTETSKNRNLRLNEIAMADTEELSDFTVVTSTDTNHETTRCTLSSALSQMKNQNSVLKPSAGPHGDVQICNFENSNNDKQSLRKLESQHKYESLLSRQYDTVRTFSFVYLALTAMRYFSPKQAKAIVI